MGDKAQPAALARATCSQVFSVKLCLHIVFAQGGGRPNDANQGTPSAADGAAVVADTSAGAGDYY
jgi:hypothetical protein